MKARIIIRWYHGEKDRKEHTELIRKFVLRSCWLGNRRGSCWSISFEWKNFSTTTAGSSIAWIAYESMPLLLRVIGSSIESHELIKSSVSTTPFTVRLTRIRFMHSPMDTFWWEANFRTDYWEWNRNHPSDNSTPSRGYGNRYRIACNGRVGRGTSNGERARVRFL